MRYKKSEYDIAQIGRHVNVDFVLEGSVHLAFRQDLMAAQLINVRDQMQPSPCMCSLFGRRFHDPGVFCRENDHDDQGTHVGPFVSQIT